MPVAVYSAWVVRRSLAKGVMRVDPAAAVSRGGRRASSTRARRMPHAVIAANHASFLDGLLLGAFLPGDPIFAVDTFIAKKWWAKPFLARGQCVPRRSDQSAVDPRDDSRGRRRLGLHHLPRGPHHDDRRADEGLRRAGRDRRAHEGGARAGAHRGRGVHAVLATRRQGPAALVPAYPHPHPSAATADRRPRASPAARAAPRCAARSATRWCRRCSPRRRSRRRCSTRCSRRAGSTAAVTRSPTTSSSQPHELPRADHGELRARRRAREAHRSPASASACCCRRRARRS